MVLSIWLTLSGKMVDHETMVRYEGHGERKYRRARACVRYSEDYRLEVYADR